MKTNSILLSAVLLFAVPTAAISQQPAQETNQPTVMGPAVWKNQPVITPAYMNERIEKTAIKYAANSPIARIIFNDIGYPLDAEEYAALE